MATPARIPRRHRRLRKSLRAVLDVAQDPNYNPENHLPEIGTSKAGTKPVRPYLYQYRIIKTDMYVAVIMNPRHAIIRSITANGPARSLAPMLDAGYEFGPLSAFKEKERHTWALGRLPDGIELFGFRRIESTPLT